MFDAASRAAREIEELTIGLVVLGTGVFMFVLVVGVIGLRRAAQAEDPEDSEHASGISTRTQRALVMAGGVVVPIVVIIAVLGWTIETMSAVPTSPPPDSLPIEVTGHQWWWEVRYPDAGIALTDELHLPVDRTVAVHLESSDVIHSFWVPSLGGKMDAIPGRTNVLVLEPERPGEFFGQCAEFCGLHHARMGLEVTVHTGEDFDRWVALQQEAAETGAADE